MENFPLNTNLYDENDNCNFLLRACFTDPFAVSKYISLRKRNKLFSPTVQDEIDRHHRQKGIMRKRGPRSKYSSRFWYLPAVNFVIFSVVKFVILFNHFGISFVILFKSTFSFTYQAHQVRQAHHQSLRPHPLNSWQNKILSVLAI